MQCNPDGNGIHLNHIMTTKMNSSDAQLVQIGIKDTVFSTLSMNGKSSKNYKKKKTW